jgi:hypothetical protein
MAALTVPELPEVPENGNAIIPELPAHPLGGGRNGNRKTEKTCRDLGDVVHELKELTS